jgi:hypothetical protein
MDVTENSLFNDLADVGYEIGLPGRVCFWVLGVGVRLSKQELINGADKRSRMSTPDRPLRSQRICQDSASKTNQGSHGSRHNTWCPQTADGERSMFSIRIAQEKKLKIKVTGI